MSKLSDALGMGMGGADASSMSDDAGMDEMPMMDEEAPVADASAEVLAMKQFDRAPTPEAKVQAMKDFLEACGLY